MNRLVFTLALFMLQFLGCDAPKLAEQQSTYGPSACADCVRQSCKSEIRACDANFECAAFLLCLGQCPLDPGGDAAAACEQACRARLGPESLAKTQQLADCRNHGNGTLCPDCHKPPLDRDAKTDLLNQSCPPATSSDACRGCVQEHCCQSADACKQNPACKAISTCIDACASDPDPDACERDCRQNNQDGLIDLNRYILCAEISCSRLCSEQSDCSDCINQSCLDLRITCFSSLSYLLYEDCFLLCTNFGTQPPDLVCLSQCGESYPEGRALSDQLGLCGLQRCGARCG